MPRKALSIFLLSLAFGPAAFAQTGPPQKIEFGVSYELIVSSNSDLIALAGPDSSIGAPADYDVGGWKFDCGLDLTPDYQVGLGFKALNGKSLSFTDAAGKDANLATNALGAVVEGKRIFRLAPGFEASVLGDAGLYWLNDSYLDYTTGIGSGFSGSAFGLFLGAGLKLYFDKEDHVGCGLDCGYQWLDFSPLATPTGNLANFDHSQASIDMSGFTVMIDCVQVSLDTAPPKGN
jgi:hypothetical protein